MSYNDKKIGKQIAGYKVELCKSKTTTKPVLLQTIRMVYRGRVHQNVGSGEKDAQVEIMI